jgi:hypothetical protein
MKTATTRRVSPEARRAAAVHTYRCFACGRRLFTNRANPTPARPCAEHPEAPPVGPWPSKFDLLLTRWDRMAATGSTRAEIEADAERMRGARILAPSSHVMGGLNEQEPALALVYFDAWGGIPERRYIINSEPVSPKGLYG